jgi:hypothetical protein
MLSYGGFEVDEGAIPQAVVAKMLSSAFAHILGNEVASQVVGKIRKQIVAGSEKKASDVSRDAVEVFREANTDLIATWEEALRSEKVKAILDGSLSVRVSRGPSRDPLESAMRMIARMEITKTLKDNKLKWPKPDETLTLAGVEVDGDTLIDRRLANPEHSKRIKALAERKVREDARLREATQKGAGEGSLAESLGI